MRLSEFAFIRETDWRLIAETAITEYWGDGNPRNPYTSLKYYCEANFEIGHAQQGQLYQHPGGQFAVWRIGHLISKDGRPLYLYLTRNAREGNNQPYRYSQVLTANRDGSVPIPTRLTPEQEKQLGELHSNGPVYPDATYHADYNIEIDMEHLVLEHTDRLRKVLPMLDGKTRVWELILASAITEAHAFAAHRDMAVPQYFIPRFGDRTLVEYPPGSYQQLLPLYLTTHIDLTTRPDLIAAVEANHTRGIYLVKTLLPPEWAYRTARCLAKDNARFKVWNQEPGQEGQANLQRPRPGQGATRRPLQQTALTPTAFQRAAPSVAAAVASPPAAKNPEQPAVAQAAPASPTSARQADAIQEPVPSQQATIVQEPARAQNQDEMAQTIERLPKGRGNPDSSVPISSGVGAPAPTREQWVSEASRRYNAKDYRQALEALKQALALDPGYALAHFYKGHTHFALNEPGEALLAYVSAIQYKADYWEAYFFKGETLRSQAEKQNSPEHCREALAAYEQVIKLNPTYTSAHLSRAYCLKFLQDVDGALAACNKAIQLQPSSVDGRMYKAYLLRKLQRFSEAVSVYDELLQMQPDYEPAQKMLQELQPLLAAKASYERAIIAWPNDPPTWHGLGEVYTKLGMQAEAQQAFQRARDLGFNR
jgi:tetratricopeptide (TPR) repeat protein